MPLTQDLLNELTQEAAVTRRYLASVPFDKATFQPHEKSETLGRLAIHVAEIVAWWGWPSATGGYDVITWGATRVAPPVFWLNGYVAVPADPRAQTAA